MDEKDAYQQKLEAQLDEWRAEIEKLRARAAQAQADARIRYQEELDELERHRSAAESKLAELRAAGGEAWQDVRQGAESAWRQLSDALQKARQRFG